MEALIVALFALAAIVILDAGYWIAISLVRWSPIIAAGALVGWIARHQGADAFEALGLGVLAALLARQAARRHWRLLDFEGGDYP
jgi:hypothetical protein